VPGLIIILLILALIVIGIFAVIKRLPAGPLNRSEPATCAFAESEVTAIKRNQPPSV
jgi:hypothetical protein